MKYNVWKEIIKFLKEHSLQKRVRKVLVCLAAVVVFCTVYALILPAITMEATCGTEEHTHIEECYELQTKINRELICDFSAHVHTEECLDENDNIVCGCAAFVVHSHTEDCYKDNELVCTLTEVIAHTHDTECGGEESCVRNVIVIHAHESSCYDEQGDLVCGKTEVLEHVHTDACFKVIDETAEKVLVCEELEHVHNDDCYPKKDKDVATEETTDETTVNNTTSVNEDNTETKEDTTKEETTANEESTTEDKKVEESTDIQINISDMVGNTYGTSNVEGSTAEQVGTKLELNKSGLDLGVETSKGVYLAPDGDTFRYYTGEAANVNISVSVVDNTSAYGNIARVYILFDSENGSVGGYTLGEQIFVSSVGKEYTASLNQTDNSNFYYWEFPALEPGDALAVNFSVSYPSATTDGGNAMIWGEIVEEGTDICDPSPNTNYHLLNWGIKEDTYTITQTYIKGSGQLVGDEEIMCIDNMHFEIVLDKIVTSPAEMGENPLTDVEYTDRLELPDNVRWRPEVVEALMLGSDYVTTIKEGYIYSTYVTTTADEQFLLCSTNTDEFSCEVSNGEVVFKWTDIYTPMYKTVIIGSQVLEITDIENIAVNDTIDIKNIVTAKQSFKYSGDRTISVSCDVGFICGAPELEMVNELSADFGKTWVEAPDDDSFKANDSNSEWYNIGNSQWFRIRLKNIGILPYTTLGRIEDTLTEDYYISGDNLQTMFDEDENHRLSVTISSATLCQVPDSMQVYGTNGNIYEVSVRDTGINTDYNGRATIDDSVITDTAELVFAWDDEGDLTLAVSGEEVETKTFSIGLGKDYEDIQAAMDAVGYIVNNLAQYKVEWSFEEDFCLYGAQELSFFIRSTVKDSFNKFKNDINGTWYTQSDFMYWLRNVAYAYDKMNIQVISDALTEYYTSEGSQDIWMSSYCYKDDVYVSSTTPITKGDVLEYRLSYKKYNNSVYDVLPVVCQLQGGQLLRVDVADNVNVSWINDENVEVFDEGKYYLLGPGIYTGVTVGGSLADRVVVTSIEEGLTTRIYWYETTTEKTFSEGRKIYTLVDSERAYGFSDSYLPEDQLSYSISGEWWINDHETYRTQSEFVTVVGMDVSHTKKIVAKRGLVPEDDELLHQSIISEGDKVTYRLSLNSSKEAIFSGKNMYDILPAPKASNNYWVWTKDVNVSIEYSDSEGVINPDSEKIINGDGWTISNYTPDGKSSSYKVIRFDDVSFKLSSEDMYIYITLTFPEDVAWGNFTKGYGATQLTNKFYVYSAQQQVYHYLSLETKAFLQTGIYSTGARSSNKTGVHEELDEDMSRLFYANDTKDPGIVCYYITLVNTGQSRLYLDKLQVVLPKGFIYDGLVTASGSSQKTSGNYLTVETQNVISGCNISSSVVTTSEGIKNVEFIFKNNTSGGNISLDYNINPERTMPYLSPGKGVQFAFRCRTNGVANTEDLATASVGFSYYNYNDSELQLDTETNVTVLNSDTITPNDGTRALVDAEQAAEKGFTVTEDDTTWLVSDVSISRGDIEPNFTKQIESVTQDNGAVVPSPFGAKTNDVINWSLLVSNDGNATMCDYTITDIMPKPYKFTAIKYTITNPLISYSPSKTIDLGTLTKRQTLADGTEQVYSSLGKVWLTIGGDAREITSGVYLSIGLNELGNEVIKLRFTSDAYALSPYGGTGKLIVSTQNNTNFNENTIYYNTAYFTPELQTFVEEAVTKGTVTPYDDKPSIRSSRPIAVSYGAFTSSEKSVYLSDDVDNTASSMSDENFIVVPGNDKFVYTLSVTNSTNKAMTKLILIDNLPEPGDHSPFSTEELRNSDFKVSLLDDPGFVLTIKTKDGTETTLDSSKYTIEYSTATEFTDADWKGTSNWNASAEEARSIRLKLLDDAGTLIPAEAVITLTFKAKVADGQSIEPGETAWNSFGYYCRLKGDVADLVSAPLNVGVRVSNVPSLVKTLGNSVGGTYVAEQDETFRFVVYTGKALTLSDEFTEAALAQLLADNSREYTYVELTVSNGSSTASLRLDNCTQYSFENGTWVDTNSPWIWENTHQYTVVELPIANDEFSFSSINKNIQHSYSFLYNNAVGQILTVLNTHSDWSIRVNKYSSLIDLQGNNITLPGAVFGLYSPIESDKLSDEEYAELTNTIGEEAAKTVVSDGVTYYLSAIDTSDTSGIAQFDSLSLSNDKYVVKELMAPSGHFILDGTSEVVIAQSSATENLAEIEVINRAGGAKLPETGGIGTTPYIIVGLLIMGIATYCIYKQAKRRKEGMVS